MRMRGISGILAVLAATVLACGSLQGGSAGNPSGGRDTVNANNNPAGALTTSDATSFCRPSPHDDLVDCSDEE